MTTQNLKPHYMWYQLTIDLVLSGREAIGGGGASSPAVALLALVPCPTLDDDWCTEPPSAGNLW